MKFFFSIWFKQQPPILQAIFYAVALWLGMLSLAVAGSVLLHFLGLIGTTVLFLFALTVAFVHIVRNK